jgi:ankyrin repeat protein
MSIENFIAIQVEFMCMDKNKNCSEYVKSLLELYDINQTFGDEIIFCTLLHGACVIGKLRIVLELINNGADIEKKNSDGQKPFDLLTVKKRELIESSIV